MVYEGTRKFYFDLDLSHTSNTVRDKFSVVQDGNLTNSFPVCFVLFFFICITLPCSWNDFGVQCLLL